MVIKKFRVRGFKTFCTRLGLFPVKMWMRRGRGKKKEGREGVEGEKPEGR